MAQKKSAIVILAEGNEEMEFVVTVDVLRRAGVEVTVAGLAGPDIVKCSRDVLIKPDISLAEAKTLPYDAVAIVGGPAHKTLAQSPEIGALLKEADQNKKLIAAICAAPVALKAHNIGAGKRITSYPSVKCEFEGTCYIYDETQDVIVDGNIITSRGPGTSFKFALAIVKELFCEEASKKLAEIMLVK